MADNNSDQFELKAFLEEFTKALNENGEKTRDEKDRLILTSLNFLLRLQVPLAAKMDKLEDKNFIMWTERNPGLWRCIMGAVAVVFLFHDTVVHWILANLGTLLALMK